MNKQINGTINFYDVSVEELTEFHHHPCMQLHFLHATALNYLNPNLFLCRSGLVIIKLFHAQLNSVLKLKMPRTLTAFKNKK
jgi:hypothetical protein